MATVMELDIVDPDQAAIAGRLGPRHRLPVSGTAVFMQHGPVRRAARGRWCLFRMTPFDLRAGVPFLDLLDAAGHRLHVRHLLGAMPRVAGPGCWAVGYVPRNATSYRLGALGGPQRPAVRTVQLTPVTASLSALFLLAGRPSALSRLLRRRRRLRRALAELAITYNHPSDYRVWLRCFEPERTAADRVPLRSPRIGAVVFHSPDADAAPLRATMGGMVAAVPARAVERATQLRAALAGLDCDYVAILQAGEIVPPHAWRLAQGELRRLDFPSIAIADTDEVDRAGERSGPQFRPEPNHALILSGTLSRGVWFVHRDVLAGWSGEGVAPWAECVRLDLWLDRYARGLLDTRRIPYVLSHRGPDTPEAPPAELARVADAHLDRVRIPFRATATFPVRLTLKAAVARPANIVVPSALRTARALDCILSLLGHTAHPDFALLVVVAQPDALDAAQRAAADKIAADSRARVIHLARPSFNYAQANNAAARTLRAGDLCLVNDDVTPLAPDWLEQMGGHLADPRVGVVGAKLTYPDGSIQHAGIIMGMGGLCDHAHRNLPPGEVGYMGRAALVQEFSAVTGACMLVRDGLFGALGGLDEGYPSAFNDVDFCLRARARGFAVVYAAEARLTHHEMQTYGAHYAGARAPFEQAETGRMRARWHAVIAADPFHSPNLDLMPGREWSNAFPPRTPPDIA